MNRGKGADGPEDVDATFAEIVADLRAEGVGVFLDEDPFSGSSSAGPEASPGTEPEAGEAKPKPAADPPAPAAPPPPSPEGWRTGGTDWDTTMFSGDPAEDDEHYVPPEPPPLPRWRKGAFIVLLFFVVGLLLLIVPNLIGVGPALATPLGILSLATGIALLLLRVRQGPPPGADPSNGAQV
ncbi:hypothetical protein G3I59_22980 [Amycolatopsis rubida]|uniref:DUF308 domain-containing protein n=1 Tax=Amycolatopsis rubida TaxID=112413 RepID=A0A1I6BI88_9PSEU|nr:hypothetical protein [Amycolatopsis rubida]MYW93408.1 hypothetical protein [Amycolatopsis rubida]NEC58395.1 hypothetical protein [Amycolatopsis rubida]SFQ80646.1 hypothetical protein SAMN05421854_12821 [Amycolatopsis rubida]